MKKKTGLLLILSLLVFPNHSNACTTFCLSNDHQLVLSKNLDWDFDFGLITVNQKGLLKKALVNGNDTPIEWVSKYGSVTFNHIGKEFPLGGMNEAGLVIEEMNLYWTQYPIPDKRPALNELQWIQYQLDNYSTVQEVINSDSVLRISPDLFRIHYLVCDKKGNVATIEFLDGKLVYHTGNPLIVPVLTNHKYQESVEALKKYMGFGGTKEIPQQYESLNNFVKVSSMIQNYSTDIPVVNYAFDILSAVSTYDTQWSIVYDISNARIYFKTRKGDTLKHIDLGKISFSCLSPVYYLDVNTKSSGDVSDLLMSDDPSINNRLVFKIYDAFLANDYLNDEFDKSYFDKIAAYPEKIKCNLY